MENTKKRIILIIEDDIILLKTLTDNLINEGFSVLQAKGGEEGLAIALSEHPDLILLDILMPKMNGIEMAKKIRKDAWGKNVKIVVLTNLAEMEKVQQELKNSIYEYLIKSDIKIDRVVEKVKQILR